jgi:hypothetical protein
VKHKLSMNVHETTGLQNSSLTAAAKERAEHATENPLESRRDG